MFDAMQATAETTLTQETGNIAVLLQKPIALRIVPAKVQGCYQGDGHHLGIAEATLPIFPMVQGHQHIGTNAIDCYNLGVHGSLPSGWLVCYPNSSGPPMDFS